MGLGRRKFLSLTGLALAGMTIDPLKTVAVNSNYYVNTKFGIILEKPDNWGFVAVKDYGRLMEEQILPENIEPYKKELYEDQGEPAFVITKYWQDTPELKGKFSPTIVAHIHHRSAVDFEYGSFEELIELSGQGAILLKNFEHRGMEGPLLISGCKSYIRKGTYSFEHVELTGPVRTNLKEVIVEHNDFYYFIDMHDADEVHENAQREFDTCIRSIKLV